MLSICFDMILPFVILFEVRFFIFRGIPQVFYRNEYELLKLKAHVKDTCMQNYLTNFVINLVEENIVESYSTAS
jgi:hypothetical protein